MKNIGFDRKQVNKTIEYYKLKYKLAMFDYALVQDLNKEFAKKMNGFIKKALIVHDLALKNAKIYFDDEDKKDKLERVDNALKDVNWVKQMAQTNITKD